MYLSVVAIWHPIPVTIRVLVRERDIYFHYTNGTWCRENLGILLTNIFSAAINPLTKYLLSGNISPVTGSAYPRTVSNRVPQLKRLLHHLNASEASNLL